MQCRHAQDQLLVARDAPLGAREAAELARHVATCADCRAVQNGIEAAVAAWRETEANVTVPDAQTEWHAVRRKLRQAPARPSLSAHWSRLLRLAAPLTAVAAIALIVWQSREPGIETVPSAAQIVAHDPDETWSEMAQHFAFAAHAEYVETDNEEASPFVYVDDESGWLIVWASDPADDAVSI